jgi:hypothetical protein
LFHIQKFKIMEIENININATENNGKPVEVILREGKAAPVLEPKAPSRPTCPAQSERLSSI